MGQKYHKDKKTENTDQDKTESLLFETFKNTDLDFSFKEITTLKLRMKDAENYFITSFDFLLYFNSYVFHERLNIIYDNFSHGVEKWNGNKNSIFKVLVDFDDETESIFQNEKIDLDSLFTIIFEPLEIHLILFFFMTNCNKVYIEQFFEQLYENIYMYKSTRKYNIMFFLLPNTDYFIRNETYVMYLVNEANFEESLNVTSDETFEFKSEFSNSIFLSLYFTQLFKINYTQNGCNSILEHIIKRSSPGFIRSVFLFDFYCNMNDFIIRYERELGMLDITSSNAMVNVIHILMNPTNIKIGSLSHRKIMLNDLDSNSHSNDSNLLQNIEILLKKVLNNQEKSSNEKSVLIIRLIYKYKDKPFIPSQTDSPLIAKAKELVYSLINDSFIYSSKKRTRKFILEFYQLDINGCAETPRGILSSSSPKINNQSTHDSSENIMMKTQKTYRYMREQIYFCWFLTKNHVTKMKKAIKSILTTKINKKEDIIKVFSYLFTPLYYISSQHKEEGNVSLLEIEQKFYA